MNKLMNYESNFVICLVYNSLQKKFTQQYIEYKVNPCLKRNVQEVKWVDNWQAIKQIP